jgi:hypothetical protein
MKTINLKLILDEDEINYNNIKKVLLKAKEQPFMLHFTPDRKCNNKKLDLEIGYFGKQDIDSFTSTIYSVVFDSFCLSIRDGKKVKNKFIENLNLDNSEQEYKLIRKDRTKYLNISYEVIKPCEVVKDTPYQIVKS